MSYLTENCELCRDTHTKAIPFPTKKVYMFNYRCRTCYQRDYRRWRRCGERCEDQIKSLAIPEYEKPRHSEFEDKQAYLRAYGVWFNYWVEKDPEHIKKSMKYLKKRATDIPPETKPKCCDYTDRKLYNKAYSSWNNYYRLWNPNVIERQRSRKTYAKQGIKYKFYKKPTPNRPKRWFEKLPDPPQEWIDEME